MQQYRPKIVADIIDYYGPALYDYPEGITIKQRLERLAQQLWQAVQDDNDVVKNQINNYHPEYISKDWALIKEQGFSEANAYDSIAYVYGFKGWRSVSEEPINITFEKAIDTLLTGDIDRLTDMIRHQPHLVNARSQYGHGAPLLHYVGSNGIELYRQVVPMNLSEVMICLLDHGCDHKATIPIYGGHFNMIDLMLTSAHPKAAKLDESVHQAYINFTEKNI